METHFFISARTQFENLGDALINQVLFENTRKKGTLNVDCNNVLLNYQRVSGIRPNEAYNSALCFYKKMLLLRLCGKKVTYLLKPGHFFTSKDSLKQVIHDIITIFTLFFMRILGIKIKRFGASLSPFSPISLVMEKIKAALSHKITYREDYSRKFLEENKFKNISFCPDLLFYPEYKPFKALDKEIITIAFSFRSSPLKQGEDISYMQNIKHFIKLLNTQENYRFVAISQVERDIKCQEQIMSHIGIDVKHYAYDKTINGRKEIDDGFAKADIIISNRLHGLLNGAIHGCHPIAFVSPENHKVTGVLKTAKLDSLIIDHDNYSLEDFIAITKRDSVAQEMASINLMRQELIQTLNTDL